MEVETGKSGKEVNSGENMKKLFAIMTAKAFLGDFFDEE